MSERVMSKGNHARCRMALCLAVPMLLAGPASAQQSQSRGIIRDVKSAVDERENAPFPDADTGEAGGSATASGSFQSTGGGNRNVQGQGTLRVRSQPTRVSQAEADADGETASLDDMSAAFDEGGESAAPSEVPELHSVKTGDTLYTLCQKYYGDPYKWPQLWALNPLITNPHWIFPGDVVRLRSTDGDTPMAEIPMDDPGAVAPGISTLSPGGASGAVDLRRVGFMSDEDFRAAGKITGSREEKIMLATDDQVYVGFPKKQPMQAGERYTVFSVDTEHPVKDAKGKTLGYLVFIHGDLVLEQVADEQSGRGTLVDVSRVIERGQFASAQVKHFKRVAPRPSEVNLEARVVASFAPSNMLGPDNFVVLSRGAKDGLEVGNRSFVIRRGDGYARILGEWEKYDERFPKEVVAELMVVDVQDEAAVAWVVRSTKELRVGEFTEMRKGY